jgi:LysM repeat protein
MLPTGVVSVSRITANITKHLPNLRDGLPDGGAVRQHEPREFRGLRLSTEARAAVTGMLVALMFLTFLLIRLDPAGGSAGSLSTVSAKTLHATWVVKQGQTFTLIAQQTGLSVAELEDLNPYTDPGALDVGQRIRLRAP